MDCLTNTVFWVVVMAVKHGVDCLINTVFWVVGGDSSEKQSWFLADWLTCGVGMYPSWYSIRLARH